MPNNDRPALTAAELGYAIDHGKLPAFTESEYDEDIALEAVIDAIEALDMEAVAELFAMTTVEDGIGDGMTSLAVKDFVAMQGLCADTQRRAGTDWLRQGSFVIGSLVNAHVDLDVCDFSFAREIFHIASSYELSERLRGNMAVAQICCAWRHNFYPRLSPSVVLTTLVTQIDNDFVHPGQEHPPSQAEGDFGWMPSEVFPERISLDHNICVKETVSRNKAIVDFPITGLEGVPLNAAVAGKRRQLAKEAE